MLTTELKHEIDRILETALLMAPKGSTLKELTRRVFASERKVFDQAAETWIPDRIEWMLARLRRTITPVDLSEEAQFMLPGFERIPRRLTMKTGKRVALQTAILAELREYRAALILQLTTKRNTLAQKDPAKDPRVIALDKLIALMLQYAKPGKTVTVADVMAAEKAKQDWR